MTKGHMPNLEEHLNIAICVPSLGGWRTSFGRSLVGMVQNLQLWRPDPSIGIKSLKFRLITQESSMLVQSRHNLVVEALKSGASHVLFLDSDMTFPRDTLVRLLMRGKDVIGVNATTRAYPVQHIAHGQDGKRIDSRGKVGVQKVQHVGMAVFLITRKALDKLRPPLFMMEWIPDIGAYCGEDVYFCAKIQQAGMDIWIDHDLSQEVGHEGIQMHGPNMIGLEKPMPLAEGKEAVI